jgi:hypothetical protein
MPIESKPVALQPGEGVIRCPAVRSLIKDGKLQHEELQSASVQELVKVFSGQDRNLAPSEPGSLANVAGFFAIVNHGVPEDAENKGHGLMDHLHDLFEKGGDLGDAAKVAGGKSTNRRFNLRFLGSNGDHPGTVDFFKDDESGEFQAEKFRLTMAEVSDGQTLTIQGIARMIIKANGSDPKASALDLAKSSGEWALMVCVLRADGTSTDIPVADLERMYSQADPTQLLIGSRRATATEWVKVTAQITAAIATEKGHARMSLAAELHHAFGRFNTGNDAKICPCMTCNPHIWRTLGS